MHFFCLFRLIFYGLVFFLFLRSLCFCNFRWGLCFIRWNLPFICCRCDVIFSRVRGLWFRWTVFWIFIFGILVAKRFGCIVRVSFWVMEDDFIFFSGRWNLLLCWEVMTSLLSVLTGGCIFLLRGGWVVIYRFICCTGRSILSCRVWNCCFSW